jgi:hypothetical protein
MAVWKPTVQSNVIPGDVVIFDADNDNSVETTTDASSPDVAGVCSETIASGNPAIVESDGDLVIVNVAAGTARDQYLVTHTVAGQAIGVDTWQEGIFARARSSVGTPGAGQCYAVVNIGWSSGIDPNNTEYQLNNETGALIAAGKAVYMATTGSLEIALASNAATGTALARGVTTESIANGATGGVIFHGSLVTGTWATGDRNKPVYLSTTGDMTVTRPAAEAIISIIGFVMDTDRIFVNPTLDYIYG